MKDGSEFQTMLDQLGLSGRDAALVFNVSARTIQRWLQDPSLIPEPERELLRAWTRLHDAGLAWRPGSIDIGLTDRQSLVDLVARHRQNAIELGALLRRVEA